MKKIVSIILVLSLPSNFILFAEEAAQQITKEESYQAGILDAKENHSALGWGIAGLAGGLLCNVLGTGLVVGRSVFSFPAPESIPENVDIISYQKGFEKEARKKNIKTAALTGLGASILEAIVITTIFAVELNR